MPLTRSRYGMAPKRHRTSHRRTVMLAQLPNGLTIANLFCGIFAVVLAARHNFSLAGMYIVLGGVADALDGRVARATGSGSRIGAELDSLVDVISFGFAPALLMFFAVLNQENWTWLFVFFYTMCACIRLARFNVEQAGRAKRYFHGLPSPAAGLTLATYYWFSQTDLYKETMIANVPWNVALLGLMAVLSWLMISNVSYPAVPTVGYKSKREIIGSIVVFGTILGLFFIPKEFFFPACLAYVLYGFGKTALLGLLGKRDTALLQEVANARRPAVEDMDDESLGDESVVSVASSPRLMMTAETPLPTVPARRRRRRRPPRSGGERMDRAEREERGERSERRERPERRERGEPSDRGERRERPDRGEPSERLDRTERLDQPEHLGESDRPEQTNEGERSERSERPDRPERRDRSGRRDRYGRRRRSDRPDRQNRPERNAGDGDSAPPSDPPFSPPPQSPPPSSPSNE